MMTIATKTMGACTMFKDAPVMTHRELLRDGVRVTTLPRDWPADKLDVALEAANAYLVRGEDDTSKMIAACNGDPDIVAMAYDLINA